MALQPRKIGEVKHSTAIELVVKIHHEQLVDLKQITLRSHVGKWE